MNEKNEVGKIVFESKKEPLEGTVESSLPSSASEFKIISGRLDHIEEHLVYVTKLLEAVVNNMSLANNSRTTANEMMQLNSKLIAGLFAGKEFEGKELFMEMIEKINKMGSQI